MHFSSEHVVVSDLSPLAAKVPLMPGLDQVVLPAPFLPDEISNEAANESVGIIDVGPTDAVQPFEATAAEQRRAVRGTRSGGNKVAPVAPEPGPSARYSAISFSADVENRTSGAAAASEGGHAQRSKSVLNRLHADGYPSLENIGWKKASSIVTKAKPADGPRLSQSSVRTMVSRIWVTSARRTDRRASIAEVLNLDPQQVDTLHMLDEDLQEKIEGDGGEHGKLAAIMIWLGILIDAVPESLVLGILASSGSTAGLVSFTVGVFLANFPEAMSSSGTMLACGVRRRTIMLMWSAIWLITGAGAMIGAAIFPPVDCESTLRVAAISGIEGLAGGAMLTMIANSVMPEAFEQGGDIAGICTLLGFLSALAVKGLGQELEGDSSSSGSC